MRIILVLYINIVVHVIKHMYPSLALHITLLYITLLLSLRPKSMISITIQESDSRGIKRFQQLRTTRWPTLKCSTIRFHSTPTRHPAPARRPGLRTIRSHSPSISSRSCVASRQTIPRSNHAATCKGAASEWLSPGLP